MLTLLCCVLAHMKHTRLEDITEVHILEWKAVVQEAIEGGFWLHSQLFQEAGSWHIQQKGFG